MLDDKRTAPADIEIIEQSDDESILRVTLREGRKRQIRRIAAAFGHPVRQLLRTRIGPLKLGDLQPAEWRHLSQKEIRMLLESMAD